ELDGERRSGGPSGRHARHRTDAGSHASRQYNEHSAPGPTPSAKLPRRCAMPRVMWKGAISFGLVTIPVGLYPATEEKTLRFNQLHDEDMGRIKYKRVCSIDGEEAPFDHIVKGYEYEKDKYVVLTDEDLEA